jgi:hypothetical protein
MIPRVAASLSGVAPKRGQDRPTLRRGPVVIHRVCGLIPRDHEYSIPSNANAPFAPLINSQEDQVLLHLDTMSASTDNLLWNIINIAAQNKGSKSFTFVGLLFLIQMLVLLELTTCCLLVLVCRIAQRQES